MRFHAHIDQLAPMLAWIRSEGAKEGLDSKTLHQIELASEEGITNIIHHAYPNQAGEIEITCEKIQDERFRVILSDEGRAANPLESATPVDLDAPAADRPLGGLGVFLIQNLMDEVRYAREGKYNVLTLDKRLPSSRS